MNKQEFQAGKKDCRETIKEYGIFDNTLEYILSKISLFHANTEGSISSYWLGYLVEFAKQKDIKPMCLPRGIEKC
jgi:hypothetical protein